ncbi:MAG: DNA polymerase III subunit beta [Saccharofermentanales bacterium]
MKIVCSRNLFIEAINIVQKAISPRPTLPILDGILIEAEDNIVKLTGYDLETGIECRLDADVIEKGNIVINARIFGEIIKKLPDEIVTIEVGTGNTILIESGSSFFSIKGINSEGYPKIPTVEDYEKIVIPQNTLKDMINQTIFAVSNDESRPVLNGCYFVCDCNTVEIVAIDGFRLALRKNMFDEQVPTVSFIVPGKSLNEVGRVLTSNETPIEIYKSKNHILFDTGKVKMVSRLIAGEYMNYRSIIPQSAETSLIASPAALLSSIERASLIITSDDRKFPVRLMTIDDETLVVSSNTDLGSVREEIKISMSGNKIDIDFNPKYFIDALKAINEDEISLSFNGNMGPCVLKPVDGDDFAYLVLPLRR